MKRKLCAAVELKILRRAHGIAYEYGGRVWWLAPPSQRPPRPRQLAKALFAPALPEPNRMALLLGCQAAAELDRASVARWALAAKRLHALQVRIPEDCLNGLERARRGGPTLGQEPAPDALALALARVATLYGHEFAKRAESALLQPWAGARKHCQARDRRIERWLDLGSGAEPENEQERRIRDRTGDERRSGLAYAFLQWMSEFPQILTLRQLRKLVPDQGDQVESFRALARAWVAADPERVPDPGAAGWQARLALCLTHPELCPSPGPELGVKTLEELAARLKGIESDKVQRCWEQLNGERAADAASLLARVRESEGLRALQVGVVGNVCALARQPRRLKRFLRWAEKLFQAGVSSDELDRDWVLERLDHPWAHVLGWLEWLRSQEWPEDHKERVLAALADLHPVVRRCLDDRLRVRSEAPPWNVEWLSARTGLSVSALHEYLHHARTAGGAERFPLPFCQPLLQGLKDGREAHHVRRLLRLQPTESLRLRLAELTSAEGIEGRRVRAARLTAKHFPRLLAAVRERSLDAVIRRAQALLLPKALQAPVPLPAEIARALHLLRHSPVKLPLLLDFLRCVLHGMPLSELPANQAWLRKARGSGVDVEAWMRGFDVEAGHGLRIHTESDPLNVLPMGSLFQTCLTLEDGLNGHSVLINALDVNKHVVYARLEGKVVGRKLIGATAAGELAGYHTYGHESIGEACQEFARGCGLRMSACATPEELHAGDWYDDGNTGWRLVWPARDGGPDDAAAREEAALQEAGTPELLELGEHGTHCNRAAAVRLMAAGGLSRKHWARLSYDTICEVARESTANGLLRWTREPLPFDGLAALLSMPPQLAVVREAARAVDLAVRGRGCPSLRDCRWLPELPASAAVLPLHELMRFLDNLLRLFPEAEPRWCGNAARCAGAAYLRDRDPRPLLWALGEPALVSRIALEVMAQQTVPGSGPLLRKALRKEPRHPEKLALALSRLRDRRDGPLLQALLEMRPGSLPRAFALARLPGCRESAAALWRPDPRPEFWLGRFDRLWMARCIGGHRLIKRLRRVHARGTEPALSILAGPRNEDVWWLERALGRGDPEAVLRAAKLFPSLVEWPLLELALERAAGALEIWIEGHPARNALACALGLATPNTRGVMT